MGETRQGETIAPIRRFAISNSVVNVCPYAGLDAFFFLQTALAGPFGCGVVLVR